MATYSAGEAAVAMVPSFQNFQRKVSTYLESVDEELKVGVVPELSSTFAQNLRAELDRVHATIEVHPVVGDINEFARELQTRLSGIHATIEVHPVVGDVNEFARELEARLATLHATITVDPVIGNMTQFAMLLQARLDAIRPTVHVNVDIDHSSLAALMARLGGVRAGAGGAEQGLRRMGAVKFGALFAGITALVGAIGGLVGIAGGAAAGLSAIGAAGVIGSTGIIDAFSTMKEAGETSTSDSISNAKAVRSAQESLADAYEEAARTAVRGDEQIADAERRVQDAQRTTIQSQRDLTTARKDAKREIDSLNDSLRSQVLSEEEAELAVARAYQRMQEARRDGSSALDQKEAELNYKRSLVTLDEQRKRTAELKTETEQANTAGVDGSEQVLQAKERLTEAVRAELDANTDLARTQRDVAQDNADAQKQVERAHQGVLDALDSGQTSANDFNDALANLSPNARQFVLAMQALGPQWKDLRMAVQDNLFEGLGDSITSLANNQLPFLKDMLATTASGMSASFRETFSVLDGTLTGLVQSGKFEAFKTAVVDSMSGLAPLVSGLVTGFTDLGIAVLPTIGPLVASLGDAFASMAPALGTIGASLSTTLTNLMPHLANFISALSEGLAPLMPVLGTLLASLGAALTPLIPPLSQVLQIFGGALSQALLELTPAIAPLGQAFVALVQALAPMLPMVAQVVAQLVQALAPALTTIFTAAAPVIQQLINQLTPVFEQIAPIIAQVAGIIGQALADALSQLAPMLPILVDSFSRIVLAVAPFIPQLLEITMQLLPVLIELFTELVATWLPPLTAAFEWIAKNVLPWVVTAVRDMADTWIERIQTMSNYLRDAREFIREAIANISSFFNELGTTVQRVWDGIVTNIAKAVGRVGELLQKARSIPGVGGWVGGTGDNLVTWARANGYATGGQIHGPGGPRDDVIPIWASNGEFVVNAAATEKHLPLLEAINSDSLPRYADGGRVALGRGQAEAQQYHGQAYDYGGYNGGVDCSLLASKITAALLGLDTGTRLFTTESDFEAMGFVPGLDLDGWSVGIHRGGGGPNSHMAGTLAGVPVESSGAGVFYGPPAAGANDPQFSLHYYLPREMWNPPDEGPGLPAYNEDPGQGRPAIGTPNSYLSDGNVGYSTLPDYESWATPTAPGPTTGKDKDKDKDSSSSNETSISGLFGNAAKAFVEGQIGDALGVFNFPDRIPPIVQLGVGLARGDYSTPTDEDTDAGVPPKGESYLPKTPQQDPLAGGQWTTRDQSVPATPSIPPASPNPDEAGVAYDPAAGVEQWRGVVSAVLSALSMPSTWADLTLQQMQTESGGDPQAINDWDSNAAAGTPSKGLMQVIDPTFNSLYPAFGPKTGYPQDIWNPHANIAAGLSWVVQQHGGPEGIWGQGRGYATGGQIHGPGGPRDDVIPIWASNGEFVVNAAATARHLPLLEAINSGAARMANGGLVAASVPSGAGSSAAGSVGAPIEYHTHYHVADMAEATRRENLRRSQEMQTYVRR